MEALWVLTEVDGQNHDRTDWCTHVYLFSVVGWSFLDS
jgi:hypothetical protein